MDGDGWGRGRTIKGSEYIGFGDVLTLSWGGGSGKFAVPSFFFNYS